MASLEKLKRIEILGLHVLCIIMPIQLIDRSLGPVPLSVVDILVWGLAGLFLTRNIMAGTVRRIHLPPVPIWIFLGWVVISAIHSFDSSQGVGYFAKTQGKEIFQLTEYLFVAYILFRNNASDRDLIRRLVLITGAVTLCIVAYATVQTLNESAHPTLIGGTYSNRSRFAALMALMAPIGVGIACKTRNRCWRRCPARWRWRPSRQAGYTLRSWRACWLRARSWAVAGWCTSLSSVLL